MRELDRRHEGHALQPRAVHGTCAAGRVAGRRPRPSSPEAAEQSMEAALEQFQLADELGFDWITLAEHHYAPLSLTPNPMVMAGAVSQRVRRAKIALLGANLAEPQPGARRRGVRDGRRPDRWAPVAGLLRGTATEYVTYGTNPAESRERFEEALRSSLRAWTEPQPFGWLGRYYEYRTIRSGRARCSSRTRRSSCPARARSRASSRPATACTWVSRSPRCRWPARRRATTGEQARPRRGGSRRATTCSTGCPSTWPRRTRRPSTISGRRRPRRGPPRTASHRAVGEAVARAGYYGRDAAAQRGRLRGA